MSVRTTNFDAIAAAAPLNREASTIRDGSGDLWAANVRETTRHWDAPPPPEAAMPAHVEDVTGRVIDRLTVIRYHEKRKAGGHFWLVRCACGAYELRRDKFIAAPPARSEDQEHACEACDYLSHIKWLHRHGAGGQARRKADVQLLDALAAKARGGSNG